MLQQLLNGLIIGSTYAVVALGFALVFTVLRIINFAHPEIFMVGMFSGLLAGVHISDNIVVVLVCGAAGSAVVGLILERTVMPAVEQNVRQALKVAHWAYLLEVGRVVESGPSDEIAGRESVQEVFLGGRH